MSAGLRLSMEWIDGMSETVGSDWEIATRRLATLAPPGTAPLGPGQVCPGAVPG